MGYRAALIWTVAVGFIRRGVRGPRRGVGDGARPAAACGTADEGEAKGGEVVAAASCEDKYTARESIS